MFFDLSSKIPEEHSDQSFFMDRTSLGYTLELMLDAVSDDKDYFPPEMDMTGFDDCIKKMINCQIIRVCVIE